MGATVVRVSEGRGVGSKIRCFYAMKLIGNLKMLCQPVRDLRTRYLTAAAFFEIDPRLKKGRVLGNEQI